MSRVYGGVYKETYTILGTQQVLYGEYLEYTFPIPIVPVRYRIDYAEDCVPVAWFLLGKLKNESSWTILDDYANDNVNETNWQIDTLSEYIERSTNTVRVDTIRLVIGACTGTSVKVREFSIIDELGKYMSFLVPFCTNTNSMYHSGSLNFSNIDSFSLNADLPTDFYAVGHGTLEIENGMCTSLN